jgi:hypothetical protein
MAGTLFYVIVTLTNLLLAVWMLRKSQRNHNDIRFLLSLTLLGLAYDGLIISLGQTIGVNPTLESLNHGRYLAHAALTPFYFVIAALLAERAGLPWAGANSRLAAWVVCTIIIIGGLIAALQLKFEPVQIYGLLRYKVISAQTPAWAHSFSILVSVFADVLFIALGIALWRTRRWPWLFLAAVAMFFASAPPVSFGFLLGSVGELLLNLALIASALHFTASLAEELTPSIPTNT